MDYWQHVQWHRWKNWNEFLEKIPTGAKLWFIESGGKIIYSEVKFLPNDFLIFGRETAGLPKQLLEENRGRWLRIPMFNDKSRSLNLSNCVALVLFEALRQQDFSRRDLKFVKRRGFDSLKGGRALGAVASASRLHRVGRGFESLSAHQSPKAVTDGRRGANQSRLDLGQIQRIDLIPSFCQTKNRNIQRTTIQS